MEITYTGWGAYSSTTIFLRPTPLFIIQVEYDVCVVVKTFSENDPRPPVGQRWPECWSQSSLQFKHLRLSWFVEHRFPQPLLQLSNCFKSENTRCRRATRKGSRSDLFVNAESSFAISRAVKNLNNSEKKSTEETVEIVATSLGLVLWYSSMFFINSAFIAALFASSLRFCRGLDVSF